MATMHFSLARYKSVKWSSGWRGRGAEGWDGLPHGRSGQTASEKSCLPICPLLPPPTQHWNEERGGRGRAVLIGTFDQLTPGYLSLLPSACWLEFCESH